MKKLWQDLKEIIGQIRGSQNLFGFKSTMANQLYLLYYFGGKIYFTRKLGKHVSYLWYSLVSCQILFSLGIGLYYFWWYDMKNDLLTILSVMNSIGIIHMGAIIFPLITFWYSDRIEKMINHVDIIFTKSTTAESDFKQNNLIGDATQYFSWLMKAYMLDIVIFQWICVFDIVFFFEHNKLINPLYYSYSPPLIRHYVTLRDFFIVEFFEMIVLLMMMMQLWLAFGLMIYWNVICISKLISIRNDLCAIISDKNVQAEESEFQGDWDAIFERTLQHATKEFQKTITLINHLRGFVETIGTILIVPAFFYGVICLYVVTSTGLSWILKIKCVAGYLASIDLAFLFYTVGQNLDNEVSEVSLAVYSTPWYRSTKHRQNVYILQRQTRSLKNFAVFKVYGLLYNNFSRYLHGVVSYTNILRRLAEK